MHYALSRLDDDALYLVYGKGDDPALAEQDALHNLRDDRDDTPTLRRNLIVLSREECEEQGYVVLGAPVIWYDHLGHYRVEDQDPFKPRAIEQRLHNVLR
jgi:hypothetical protein